MHIYTDNYLDRVLFVKTVGSTISEKISQKVLKENDHIYMMVYLCLYKYILKSPKVIE